MEQSRSGLLSRCEFRRQSFGRIDGIWMRFLIYLLTSADLTYLSAQALSSADYFIVDVIRCGNVRFVYAWQLDDDRIRLIDASTPANLHDRWYPVFPADRKVTWDCRLSV